VKGWLLVLFVLGCGGCRAEPPPRVGERPTLAVLGEPGIVCGAVAVTPYLAVTANHCVKSDRVFYLAPTRKGGARRNGVGVVVWREAASDLAAFAAEGLVPAELAEGPLGADRVTTLVAHVPEPWSVLRVGLSEVEHGFLRTGRLRAGMSGSGLWDDRGRLVGVAVGNDETRGYFAGTERISALLRGAPGGARLRAKAVELRDPALWEDESLTFEQMLDATKKRHDHVESELERLRQSQVDGGENPGENAGSAQKH
jgi:hypothetical protein